MGFSPFLRIKIKDLEPLRGDPSAMFWYMALRRYCQYLPKDRYGFIRISRALVKRDYGMDRNRIQYLNRKLQDLGLLELDTKKRGRRIPTGYKLAK